jgi:hypothetical protein
MSLPIADLKDTSLGLPRLQGFFLVAFTRAIGLGLKDLRRTPADIEGCTKPEGILIFLDGD